MPRLCIYLIEHRKEKRVALDFDVFPCKELDEITRNLPGRKFSASRKLWHIPLEDGYQVKLTKAFGKVPHLVDLVFQESSTSVISPKVVPSSSTRVNGKPHRVKISIDQAQKKFYVDHGYCPRLFNIFSHLEEGFWEKKYRNWVFTGDNLLYLKVKNIIEKNGFLWEKQMLKSVLQNQEKPQPKIDQQKTTNLTPTEQEILNLYNTTLSLKRMSARTCEIYKSFFIRFLKDHKSKEIPTLSYAEIFEYIKTQSATLSETGLHQSIAAIKFYYERALGRDKMFFYLKEKTHQKELVVFVISGVETNHGRY